jgi:peptide deformylase
MLKNKIEEIKEKCLSVEETYKITKRINDEMQVVRRDYIKRDGESIEAAGKTYFNC